MDKNLFNLNQTSKNLLEKDKQIQANKLKYLKRINEELVEEEKEKEDKLLESAMSAARFSHASTYARSKNRINRLNEEIKYNETSSVLCMTEMVSKVVEKALLLDEEEYTKINPNYKDDIRTIVGGFLKESCINENITVQETLNIIEHISRNLPNAREGMTLTEDELVRYIESTKSENIDKDIDSLSRNVSSKVAQLMEKEQARTKEIEEEVEKVKGKKAKKEVEEVPMEEPVEVAEEELPEEEVVEEVPVKDEMEEQPAGRSIHIGADGTTSILMPNGQLSLNGDGSMDIQLMEDVDLSYPSYEEFLLSEAWSPEKEVDKRTSDVSGWKTFWSWFIAGIPGMIIAHLLRWNRQTNDFKYTELSNAISNDSEGKRILGEIRTAEANKDKKALKELKREFKDRLTVVQAELKIEKDKVLKVDKQPVLVRETMRCGLIESLAVNEARNMLNRGESYNPDLCLANAIMYVTITETMNEMGLMNIGEQEYALIEKAAGGNLQDKKLTPWTAEAKERIEAKKKEKKEENCKKEESNCLNESFSGQIAPQLNNKNPNDLAERIRQKRLLKEQENRTLHD